LHKKKEKPYAENMEFALRTNLAMEEVEVQAPVLAQERGSVQAMVVAEGEELARAQGLVQGLGLAQEAVAARELALAGVRGPAEAVAPVRHRYKGRDNKNDLSQELSMKQYMPYSDKCSFE
jgi:hypothetical protein